MIDIQHTDKQMDRQTDTSTDNSTDRWRNGQIDERIDGWTD